MAVFVKLEENDITCELLLVSIISERETLERKL